MPPPATGGAGAGAGAAPRKIEKEEAKEIIAEMEAIVDDPANKVGTPAPAPPDRRAGALAPPLT